MLYCPVLREALKGGKFYSRSMCGPALFPRKFPHVARPWGYFGSIELMVRIGG
jgi:hypothetical protein